MVSGKRAGAARPRAPGRPRPSALRRLQLFVFDVDGVLTDGAIYLGPGDLELKRFAVEDGTAFKLLEALGKEVAIVSGRESEVVLKRAAELGVAEVHQGVSDKAARVDDLRRARGLAPDRVFFQGDDLIDLPVMRRVGCAVAPANAPAEVRRAAAHVTRRAGGHGAVRDAVEWVLRRSGELPQAIEAYERANRDGGRARAGRRG